MLLLVIFLPKSFLKSVYLVLYMDCDGLLCVLWQNIPQSVMKEIKLKSEAVIRDEDNKIWPVKIWATFDGRRCLSTGWSDFRKHKNLMSSDECVFEPVFSDKRRQLCKEFRVRVVRRGGAKTD